MRNMLIILFLVTCVALLVLMPRPLPPASEVSTFAELSRKLGGSLDDTVDRRNAYVSSQTAAPGCDFPSVPERAKLVLVSANKGLGVSSVAIGSQDTEVTAAKVTVENGIEPIYLVIALGQPILWTFQGNLPRVTNLVIIGGTPQRIGSELGASAGVVGLLRNRVAFLKSECMRSFDGSDNVRSSLAAGLLRDYVGRMPDIVAGRAKVSEIQVPSGRTVATDPFSVWYRLQHDPLSFIDILGIGLAARIRPDLEKEALSEYPDGVVQVDPGAVVASALAENYEVLPDRAGLKQLIKAGAVEDKGYGEYHIKTKVRLPAQLSVATFLLLKGVPKPDGDSGMACVVSQENGQVLMSPLDRGHCL